jgi:hypothetical protein
MRRAVAAFITIMIGAAVLWTQWRRDDRSRSPGLAGEAASGESTPLAERSVAPVTALGLGTATERIERLLQCARSGDVDGYLSSFCGSLRARLEREAKELGARVFADELRRFGQESKGHAVFAAEPDGTGSDNVRVDVETAFADRTLRQRYHLTLGDGGWLVAEVEPQREQVPKNRVGSWAQFQEPEGVPVTDER